MRLVVYTVSASSHPARPLTAIVLTYNEELHIARCLRSIRGLCDRIVVVDSNSTDATRTIAEELGAEVLRRPWPNKYAEQFNWGIDQADARTPWMLRIDADEYLTPELQSELSVALANAPEETTGFILPRLVKFQNRPIRWGGFYPQLLLRVWRTGAGRCEERMMDEHMVVQPGNTIRLKENIVDHNLNDIFWWTSKHNGYARREAADLIATRHRLLDAGNATGTLDKNSSVKRWVKVKIYSRLPGGLRAGMYFFYRFFLRAGFLDHPRVWVFHFLQAAWYRTLVDINVREFEDSVGEAGNDEKLQFLKERWKISIETR